MTVFNVNYDSSKLNGANDLYKDAPTAGGDWIEVDGDGNLSTTDDKVLVNKQTGDVYIGDNCKGTVDLSKVLDEAHAAGLAADKGLNTVILDDDNGEAATVNVNVDINKLVMDNDALTGGTAAANVTISGQTDALDVVSDMDVNQTSIAAAGTEFGVDADMKITDGSTLNFSGSNDVVFSDKTATAEKLADLNVFNNFDIVGEGTTAAKITGKVIQNIDYSEGVGEALGDSFDWAWMQQFSGTKRTLTEQNCEGIIIGGTYHGHVVKDVKICSHAGVIITYEDESTETLKLVDLDKANGLQGISVYDPNKGTLTLVADKVYTWNDPAGGVSSSSSGSSSDGTITAKKSDPTNHFKVSGKIDASELAVDQNNVGKIGSSVGALSWLARNEVDYSGVTDVEGKMADANLKQNIDISVEGNGGKIGFDANSGNKINDAKNEAGTVKITEKGDSVDRANLGDLVAEADIAHEDFSLGKEFFETAKGYKTLISPDIFDSIIKNLQKATSAAEVQAAFDKAVADNNLDATQKDALLNILDGDGDGVLQLADVSDTITTPVTTPAAQ